MALLKYSINPQSLNVRSIYIMCHCFWKSREDHWWFLVTSLNSTKQWSKAKNPPKFYLLFSHSFQKCSKFKKKKKHNPLHTITHNPLHNLTDFKTTAAAHLFQMLERFLATYSQVSIPSRRRSWRWETVCKSLALCLCLCVLPSCLLKLSLFPAFSKLEMCCGSGLLMDTYCILYMG